MSSLTTADHVMFVGMRVGAAISLLGSICILLETWADKRANKASTVTRLLFAMQFAQFFWDFGYITGMTMVPKGTIDYPGALGNTATCVVQGFAVLFGSVTVSLYDVAISITYVLMLRFNWPTSRLERYEKLHFLIWPIGLAFCIVPIVQQTYNFNWGVCFVQTLPPGCVDTDCTRGTEKHAVAVRTANNVFVWITIAVSIISMALIIQYMLRLERRNARYAFNSSVHSTSQRSKSRKMAVQGILYVSTYLLAFLPISIYTTVHDLTGYTSSPFVTIAVLLTSLHGFFYTCFFLLPRGQMNTAYGRFLKKILCCSCLSKTLHIPKSIKKNSTEKDDHPAETTLNNNDETYDDTKLDVSNLEATKPHAASFEEEMEQQQQSGMVSNGG